MYQENQVKWVAERLALYGMAGKLATEYGLTGWPIGDALKAAGEGFRLWLSERRPSNDEKRQILKQVSDFIDRHGDARFSDANIPPADHGPIILAPSSATGRAGGRMLTTTEPTCSIPKGCVKP